MTLGGSHLYITALETPRVQFIKALNLDVPLGFWLFLLTQRCYADITLVEGV